MQLPADTVDDLVARLRRVEGQVRGIARMIDDGRDCRDVITQFSAAAKALEHAGFKYFANALAECIADPEAAAAEGYTQGQVRELFVELKWSGRDRRPVTADVAERLAGVEDEVRQLQKIIAAADRCETVVRSFASAGRGLEFAAFLFFADTLGECLDGAKNGGGPGYSREEMEQFFLKLA